MEKDFAANDDENAYQERKASYGGADKSGGRRMSAAEQAAEAARRQSVAVNIVENPLKVH